MQRQMALAIIFCFKVIPLAFFLFSLPVILRLEGHSLGAIGMLTLTGIPYFLKFLWAPFVDLNSHKAGHYLMLIRAFSALEALMLLLIASLDIQSDLFIIAILILCLSVVVSVMDIALDGLYVKIFGFDQRGLSSSIRAISGYVALLVADGGLLYFYNQLGFSVSVLILMLLVFIRILASFLVKEDSMTSESKREFFLKNIYGFFQKIGMKIWVFLIFIKSIAAWSTLYMIKPMMVDLQINPEEIALISGVFGVFISLCFSIVTLLPSVQKLLLYRREALLFSLFLSALGVFFALFLPSNPDKMIFYLVVGFLNIATSFSAIISSAIFMDFSRQNCGGVDYSIQMSFANIAPMTLIGLSAGVIEMIGYVGLLQLFFAISILAFFANYRLFKGQWIENKDFLRRADCL